MHQQPREGRVRGPCRRHEQHAGLPGWKMPLTPTHPKLHFHLRASNIESSRISMKRLQISYTPTRREGPWRSLTAGPAGM